MRRAFSGFQKSVLILICLGAIALPSCTQRKLSSAAHSSGRSDLFAVRYLSDQSMPDGLKLIPPPPASGTPAMTRDEQIRRDSLQLRGSARYALAIADADRSQDATNRAFDCALGVEIGQGETPVLYKLLAKLRLDVRAATYPAKSHYRRPRPWVANNAQVCAPSEALVRDDGSYPSARGAVGWAYAIVLANLNPARRAAILERGREFGQSRVVCDAEWQSDVDAGRTLGAAVVDRLSELDQFRSDIAAARREIAGALRAQPTPKGQCAFESQVLASK